MIIYRCENVNCGKDFQKPSDLKHCVVQINEKQIEYEMCEDCCVDMKNHLDKFFIPKIKDLAPTGNNNPSTK